MEGHRLGHIGGRNTDLGPKGRSERRGYRVSNRIFFFKKILLYSINTWVLPKYKYFNQILDVSVLKGKTLGR